MKQSERESDEQELFPALQLVLPDHLRLTAQSKTRSLFFLSVQHDTTPTLVNHQQFTPGEWRVLLPLLRGFPSVILYERLLAELQRINLAESSELIRLTSRDGSSREILRPLRDTISRLRTKVQPFYFDIATRTGMGYVITVPDKAPNTVASYRDSLK